MPSVVAVLAAHALRAHLRNPVALLFTLGVPVLLLVVVGSLYGDAVIEDRGGVPVAQFFAPALAVYAVAHACFSALAVDLALQRERGVLLRRRATPAPSAAVIAACLLAAAVLGLASAACVLAVAVLAYDVQVAPRGWTAPVVLLACGAVCFSAAGAAVVSLLRTSGAVQAVTHGALLSLAFVSDVFTYSTATPQWLERVASCFPLRHLARAFADSWNPYLEGSPWAPGALGVLSAWAVVCSVIAVRRFDWRPVLPQPGRQSHEAQVPRPAVLWTLPPQRVGGRPSTWSLAWGQGVHRLQVLTRDRAGAFFAIVFPVLLTALLPVLMSDDAPARAAAARVVAPAMAAYAVAVIACSTAPAALVRDGERGVLRRVSASPLPLQAYLAGHLFGVVALVGVACLLITAVAAGLHDVALPVARLPLAGLVLLSAALVLTAVGLALAVLVRREKPFVAVSLGTIVALGFVSEIFTFGVSLPPVAQHVAAAMPLRPVVDLLQAVLHRDVVDMQAPMTLLLWLAGALIVLSLAGRRAWLSEH
jgi:ABC-type multidrug transport system permease subunit